MTWKSQLQRSKLTAATIRLTWVRPFFGRNCAHKTRNKRRGGHVELDQHSAPRKWETHLGGRKLPPAGGPTPSEITLHRHFYDRRPLFMERPEIHAGAHTIEHSFCTICRFQERCTDAIRVVALLLYLVYKYETGIFFFKKYVKLRSVLFKACSIACYNKPLLFHQESIVFLPKRFDLTVDVDGAPGSTHEFLSLEFSKSVHFSYPVTIRCKTTSFCTERTKRQIFTTQTALAHHLLSKIRISYSYTW